MKKFSNFREKIALIESKPLLWLVIPLTLLVFFYIYPLFYSIFMSFANWSILKGGDPTFAGINNFKEIFLNDPRWLTGVRNTLIIMVSALIIEMVLGFFIGVLLSINIKGKIFFRNIIIIPIFVMPVVAASIFKSFFNYDNGIINYFLNLVRLQPVEWLMGFPEGIYSAIIVDVWQWTSFVAIIMLSSIESLPRSPCEAAIVDGASTPQLIRFITIPLLRNTILLIMFLRVIDLARFFEVVFVLTGGGPGYSTETMGIYIFYKGLIDFNVGYAAALSWVLVIMVIVIMTFFLRYLQQKEVK